MDFALSDDQREIQALTREFAQAEIEPNASQWDRDHHFPRELFGKLAELGLMGACAPEAYGGAGLDFLSYVPVLDARSPAPRRRRARTQARSARRPSRAATVGRSRARSSGSRTAATPGRSCCSR